jgi:hypothetical protein
MAYAEKNFKSKKALKEAIAAGEKIGIFNPGLGTAPTNGKAFLEGPHYPAPHTWYAEATIADGVITKIK